MLDKTDIIEYNRIIKGSDKEIAMEITIQVGFDRLTEMEKVLTANGYFLYQVNNRFQWKKNDDIAPLCNYRSQATEITYRNFKRQSKQTLL